MTICERIKRTLRPRHRTAAEDVIPGHVIIQALIIQAAREANTAKKGGRKC
ncbi:MAG: hypothetical protein V3573_14635 [Desulfovibrionaceae bacterium]